MAGLHLAGFGDDGGHARRQAERSRLRSRYAQYLAAHAGLDEAAAHRVVAVLFDHRDDAGRPCGCSCHPRLSAQHGDGLACPCSWDDELRAEYARRWEKFWDSEEGDRGH